MQKKSPRHLARSLAVQGVYYSQLNSDVTIALIEAFLLETCQTIYDNADYELLHLLLSGVIPQFHDLLKQYTPYLERDLESINITEQAILVIAAFELQNSHVIPAPVIINEAIELAKLYGASDSHKFINSLVDRLAASIRPNENHANRTTHNR